MILKSWFRLLGSQVLYDALWIRLDAEMLTLWSVDVLICLYDCSHNIELALRTPEGVLKLIELLRTKCKHGSVLGKR